MSNKNELCMSCKSAEGRHTFYSTDNKPAKFCPECANTFVGLSGPIIAELVAVYFEKQPAIGNISNIKINLLGGEAVVSVESNQ